LPVVRRRHGRAPQGISGSALCVSWQNHDQVGNRPRGERATHLVSTARQKIGAAVLLLGPCIPLLFQGEEWATESLFPYFCGDDDKELCLAVDRGRTRELAALGYPVEEVSPAGALSTFLSAKVNWEELHRPAGEDMLTWYRALLALRRSTTSLWAGRFEDVHFDVVPSKNSFIMQRGDVLLAAGLEPFRLGLPASGAPWTVRLDSTGACQIDDEGRIEVQSEGCVILRNSSR
ncbi:MAG: DUF3459 domain-containing protein, partial [Myxococcota bacterium]